MLKWTLTLLLLTHTLTCLYSKQVYAAIVQIKPKISKNKLPNPNSPSAIPFYRNATSPFSSGQASRKDLLKTLKRVELDIHYDVTWDKKSFQLTNNDFYRAIEFSKKVSNKETIELYEKNESKSKTIMTLQKHTLLNLIKTESYWAQVEVDSAKLSKTKRTGWVPVHLLESKSEDAGYIATSIDTYLRKKPEQGTAAITTLPQGTFFSDYKVQGEWVEVKYKNQIGYADFNHFISRFDFTKWAKHHKWGWMQIFYRSKNLLYTSEGPIDFKDFDAWVSNPKIGIMRTSIDHGPQIRSHVHINKVSANLWAISQLSDHGEVWWKKESLAYSENNKKEFYTTEEILEKEVFSYDFNPKTKPMGVASAEGIYITNDGRVWRKLEQFEGENYPVSLHPDDVLYVGPYRSSNQGASFDPYIKWEEIAKIVQTSTLKPTRVLKLLKISPLPHSQVQIIIDTGVSKLKLKSHILSQNWTPVR